MRRFTRLLVAALAAGGCTVPPAAQAAAGSPPPPSWGRPFALIGPSGQELLGAGVAFAADGAAVIADTRQTEEAPTQANVVVRVRSPRGALSSPRTVSRARTLLAVGASGRRLALLSSYAAGHDACCTAVRFREVGADGRTGAGQALFRDVFGKPIGVIVPLPRAWMVAAASAAGVFVARTYGHGFAPARRLTGPTAGPVSLSAAADSRGAAAVAWDEQDVADPQAGAVRIVAARGSAGHVPAGPALIEALPAGHQVDELGLAAGSPRFTLGWLESFYDAVGAYHSELVTTGLGDPRRPTVRTVPREVLSGLSLAADGAGDTFALVRACTRFGRCEARAAIARAGHRFGSLIGLSRVDAGTEPALAVGADGTATVAFIRSGDLLAQRLTLAGPGRPRILAPGAVATDVALGTGPGGRVLLAFAHGDAAPRLSGVAFGG